jgi:hypothetical protein
MMFVSMNEINKWHRNYHIFQNIGHALDRKICQDFNRYEGEKYLWSYTRESQIHT